MSSFYFPSFPASCHVFIFFSILFLLMYNLSTVFLLILQVPNLHSTPFSSSFSLLFLPLLFYFLLSFSPYFSSHISSSHFPPSSSYFFSFFLIRRLFLPPSCIHFLLLSVLTHIVVHCSIVSVKALRRLKCV